jgi:hypothetical protein
MPQTYMKDPFEGFMQAFMQGLQIKQQREQVAAEQEDRKLRKEKLMHEKKRLDIEDKEAKRKSMMDEVSFLQTQPETETTMPGPWAQPDAREEFDPTSFDPSTLYQPPQPPEKTFSSHDPITIPEGGYGQPARTIKPRNLKDVLAQQLEQKRAEAGIKDESEKVPIDMDMPEIGVKKGDRIHPNVLTAKTSLQNAGESRELRRDLAAVAASNSAGKRTFGDSDKLRDDYTRQAKNFQGTADQVDKIRSAARLGNSQGDMALVYSTMRLIDSPDSAVRDSERLMARQTQSKINELRSIAQSFTEGDVLQPETRQAFVKMADELWNSVSPRYKKLRSDYEGASKRHGVDPRDVLMGDPDWFVNEEGGGGSKGAVGRFNPATGKVEYY